MPDDKTATAPIPSSQVFYRPACVDRCGRGCVIGCDPKTHAVAIVPLCCKSWACPLCAPVLARTWAWKIGHARPERFLTITCDPANFDSPRDAYEKMKLSFQKMVRVWREGKGMARGGKSRPHVFEYAAIWELQPGTGMPHLHVMQKGDYIPQQWISNFFRNDRVGRVADVRKIYGPATAARYVTKYTAKGGPDAKQVLRQNRLIMVSRHFFPAPTVHLDPANFDGWTWYLLRCDPRYLIQYLRETWSYSFTASKFPHIVELVPKELAFDLADIAFLLEDLPVQPP